MFAEAIPGVIIQLYAILSAGHAPSTVAVGSLSISVLVVGFISASISFDWDTDVMWRKIAPDFYGYLPDNARKRTGKVVTLKNEQRVCSSILMQNSNLFLPLKPLSRVSFFDDV